MADTINKASKDVLARRYLLLVIELYSCFVNDETIHGGICEIARRQVAAEMGISYDLDLLKWQSVEAGRSVPEVPF
ncbi:MAG: hypothetical protein M0Q37_01455 [Sphaerochaeta sp.]|nr:hypothetical protein [Sphaerochaeta sp.]